MAAGILLKAQVRRFLIFLIEVTLAQVDVLPPKAVDPGVGVWVVESCHTWVVESGEDKGWGGEWEMDKERSVEGTFRFMVI